MSVKRTFAFPSNEQAPAQARKAVRQVVSDWNCGNELADTAELLVSELVTNVVVHATSSNTFTIVCRVRRGQLIVTVLDNGCGSPKLRHSRDTDTNGRGLLLVDALADSWGVRHRRYGKATYFRLKLPPVTSAHPLAEPRNQPDASSTWDHSRLTHTAQPYRRRFLPAVVRP